MRVREKYQKELLDFYKDYIEGDIEKVDKYRKLIVKSIVRRKTRRVNLNI